MAVTVESKKLMNTLNVITLFLLILAVTASSQNITRCPFQYFYVFGDGFGDTGNAIEILPEGPLLPAARLPYGTTFPGYPTGRWSDGRNDADYAADGVGLPNIRPYLSLGSNFSSSRDGVNFAVASSPILDRMFFTERGINNIPSYATSLASQINWFRQYLITSVSTNPTEASNRVENSAILFANVEAHDIAYPLLQGKPNIGEVETYLPSIVDAQIDAARRVMEMGAKRVVISGSGPLGCYPYILTVFPSSNPLDYDSLGCLKSVNALSISHNAALQRAIAKLKLEFPNATILYADDYLASITAITTFRPSGGLRACCGIGGRYNYDNARFCGSPGVTVCANPKEYVFWDGMHFTQEAYRRIVDILIVPARLGLKCIPI